MRQKFSSSQHSVTSCRIGSRSCLPSLRYVWLVSFSNFFFRFYRHFAFTVNFSWDKRGRSNRKRVYNRFERASVAYIQMNWSELELRSYHLRRTWTWTEVLVATWTCELNEVHLKKNFYSPEYRTTTQVCQGASAPSRNLNMQQLNHFNRFIAGKKFALMPAETVSCGHSIWSLTMLNMRWENPSQTLRRGNAHRIRSSPQIRPDR